MLDGFSLVELFTRNADLFAGIKNSDANRVSCRNSHEVDRTIVAVLVTFMIIGFQLLNQRKHIVAVPAGCTELLPEINVFCRSVESDA